MRSLECPEWTGDANEHRSPDFARGATQLLRKARERCLYEIPQRADVEAWHLALFRKVVPREYYAGNVRQTDGSRPCLARDVYVDGLPGLNFHAVIAAVQELFEFATTELAALDLRWDGLGDAMRIQSLATIIGTVVARFIQVHPFLNGNGRTSRLLWAVLLARFGLPPQVSVVRRPSAPYDSVMRAAMAGDYAPAVVMVLTALSSAAAPRVKLPVPEVK